MTIARVKDPGWGANEKLTSGQVNALDINVTYALDKRAGQTDTLASTVSVTGQLNLSAAGHLTTVAGATVTFGSAATFNGANVFGGTATFNGALSCTSTADLHGAARCYSTLRVDGTTLLEDDLTLVGANVYFASLVDPVAIGPVINIGAAATGISFSLNGQTCTGAGSTGGDVIVNAGSGINFHGAVRLRVAGTNIASFASGSILFSKRLSVAGEVHSIPAIPAYNANITLDFSDSNNQDVGTLTGNTILAFSGAQDGGLYTVLVAQDATGSRTVTWAGTVNFGLFSGAADGTANAKTIWVFRSRGSSLVCVARNVF